MEYTITPISPDDRTAIIDIFNYYVENSFAAYPESRLPYAAFDLFLQMCAGFPTACLKGPGGATVGFGMLRPHSPLPAFSRTAEVTYFIHPEYTGKGLGKMLLDVLEKGAAEKGIMHLLASISALNPNSIRFHAKVGFTECGRFRKVGRKKGQDFDTVWMQKDLG